MNLVSLEESIEKNKIDRAISIIADIGRNKYKEAIPSLIKHFQSTNNSILRNEIAMALSDIGCAEAVEPIINMIMSKETIKNKGTLLYALESLEYSSHVELLVDLLNDDSFEVSRQALILIEFIIKDIPDEIRQKCVMKIKTNIENLQDKITFLKESMDVFDVE